MSPAKRMCLREFPVISGIQLAVIVCTLLLTLPANADKTLQINVTESDGIYRIDAHAELNVPANHVRDVLSDVVHVYRLNPSIIESEILASQFSDEIWMRTRVLCCVPVFCREFERVDAIRTLPSGEIYSEIVPELSDFASGKTAWIITPLDGDRTHLSYEATMEPEFYIPPVLGVNIVKQNLHHEFDVIFERIEHIARISSEREWSNEVSLTRNALQENSSPCE